VTVLGFQKTKKSHTKGLANNSGTNNILLIKSILEFAWITSGIYNWLHATEGNQGIWIWNLSPAHNVHLPMW